MQAKTRPRIRGGRENASNEGPDRTRLAGCKYFAGLEVERTKAYNTNTLFVVGLQETTAILALAESTRCKGGSITHIYLGALGSLGTPEVFTSVKTRAQLQQQISDLLDDGFFVTLDTKLGCAQHIHTWPVLRNSGFILMLSIAVPNITAFGGNTVLKFDDTEFGGSNGGVYVLPLQEEIIDQPDRFTPWSAYASDQPLK